MFDHGFTYFLYHSDAITLFKLGLLSFFAYICVYISKLRVLQTGWEAFGQARILADGQPASQQKLFTLHSVLTVKN